MTKSVAVPHNPVSAVAVREPRPFLFLEPARLPARSDAIDAAGCGRLEAVATPAVPMLVRALVDYTIARQNRRLGAQPIQLSVLNRRRRAARAWLLAILAGRVDGATLHAVSTQWLPTLCGTGPELGKALRPGRELIEFLRGALTACLFDEPAENLLPHARALHALEAVLSLHLAGLVHGARAVRGK